MLAVSTRLPDTRSSNPPVVLVHGAANSAIVWRYWQEELARRCWASYALDLRGHGRSAAIGLSTTTMEDYASDIQRVTAMLDRPPVVLGWSMGGLIAMLYASCGEAAACVAMAPSVPSRGIDTSVRLREGEYGAAAYRITRSGPEDQPTMPDLDVAERKLALDSLCNESRFARDQRKAGIVIESIPCPLLLVTGTEDTDWSETRYRVSWLNPDRYSVPGVSHWGLVLNRRALPSTVEAVTDWLSDNLK